MCAARIEGRSSAYYRRHHAKADGRSLYLYGYAPHEGEAGPEFDEAVSSGSEMRFHPLRQEWALYSPHRQNRTFKPSDAANPLAPARPGGPMTEIPFSDFELAIFGNRFPSLHPEAPEPFSAPWKARPAIGDAEVVVFSPAAEGSLATIGQARRILLVEALIDRYQHHFSAGAAYVLPFENRGEAVGVTLAHPHGQIYSFPVIPEPQARAADAFSQGYDLEGDRQDWGAEFSVADAGGVFSYCPPFGRFPYETWLSTRARKQGPWDFSADEVDGLASLLGDTVARYDRLFDQPMPYMMSFHGAPNGLSKGFQFSVQFYPIMRSAGRLKYLASVEQATGVFTVDVDPRAAAADLRQAG
ncbi:galactose-1-phosphate uridylyltransferase [Hyphobacterium sp. CCMP332]|uniref:galactose-1-phosphate uridylyltransferase n=1 Tax=Hyphobacterium sp. CCMP332 TaxID=2749086 RepID=UPI00164EFBEA|nr:galactose-1-phosphate uridylyltransferase [Hyphobacterium sp. CCMP332]QNL19686.1 galactose-1-phosphate uridylyltransferase [Hyphobacterium sp. CCMP332]